MSALLLNQKLRMRTPEQPGVRLLLSRYASRYQAYIFDPLCTLSFMVGSISRHLISWTVLNGHCQPLSSSTSGKESRICNGEVTAMPRLRAFHRISTMRRKSAVGPCGSGGSVTPHACSNLLLPHRDIDPRSTFQAPISRSDAGVSCTAAAWSAASMTPAGSQPAGRLSIISLSRVDRTRNQIFIHREKGELRA